jgi:hypothetical protein
MPNSWKVFSIGRWDKSVLKSDPELTLNNNVLTFTKDGKPVIPELTLDGGGTFPRVAKREQGNDTYTLKIWAEDLTMLPIPIFLGQLLQVDIQTKDEWYDTILAIPSDEVVKDTSSYYQGEIDLQAPGKQLINTDEKGSISIGSKTFSFTPCKSQDAVNVALTFDPKFQFTNFFSNGFECPIPGFNEPQNARLGGRYVNMLTGERHAIFGHIQWDADMAIANVAPYVAGEKTEPFLVIQPPPPPLPYGEAGS